jgi:peptidoglycan/xylan/chitin deacetylase (PgdA/CDA1 family)
VTSLPKRILLGTIDHPPVTRLLARLRPGRCSIVMLHRFAAPDGTRNGHDPQRLRQILAGLRAAGIGLLDLDEAISRFGAEGPANTRPPAVVFTVDDCYPDALQVGGPVFREFDCPVTGFVVPHMVDGHDWFWWDQVQWLLRQTTRRAVRLEDDVRVLALDTSTPTARKAAERALVEHLKTVPTERRKALLPMLAEQCEVALPEVAPEDYRVSDWESLRAAERQGFRFGPHTMTHPVLSRCTDEEAAWEIRTSVERVRAVFARPSGVFCYPVGRRHDFGVREMRIIEAAGMSAAVSAEPGHLDGRSRVAGADWRWQVPRFAYDERAGATVRQLLL